MREGKVSSFGWMRRADLETPYSQVWESPDGKIIESWLGEPRLAIFDTDTEIDEPDQVDGRPNA